MNSVPGGEPTRGRGTPGRGRRSHPGLDALRGLSVVLMFVVHARRLQSVPTSGEELPELALRVCMAGEPYIAASFLFIVGISLVLSLRHRPAARPLSRRLVVRSGALILLSVILFLLQFGWQWPDVLVSSGILSVIGLALLLSALALSTPAPVWALVALTAVVLATTTFLEISHTTVPGLNGGPGGALPLVAFTSVGVLVGRLWQERGTRFLTWCTTVGLASTLGAWSIGLPWITHHVSVYAIAEDGLALDTWWHDLPSRVSPITFWNHSTVGWFGLLLPLTASLGLFLGLERRLGRLELGLLPLELIGRHALSAYVGHLLVLGLIETLGLGPATAGGTWLLILALTALACGGAHGLERWRSRSRLQVPASGLSERGSERREAPPSDPPPGPPAEVD